MKTTLNFNETLDAVLATIQDGYVPLVLGPPGVGKTAMHAEVSRRLGLRPVSIIAREYEPHEISGVLEVSDGALNRHVMGAARLAGSEACCVLFDELTACPPAVFANMARVLHERCFGDTQVHPKTVFWAAANPQSQSLDAQDMPLPLINRLRIFHMEPTVREFQAYLETLGDDGSKLRQVALSFSGILEARPELLEFEPPNPEKLQQDNANWGSPRAWERCLRSLARDAKLPAKITRAQVLGDVGPFAGPSFLAIREVFAKLPKVKDIVASPETCPLPADFLEGVGVLGLLPVIAQSDACAAWVYADRINEKTFEGGRECRIALASLLPKVAPVPVDSTSPHLDACKKARVSLIANNQRLKAAV